VHAKHGNEPQDTGSENFIVSLWHCFFIALTEHKND